jgi:formylmethanofuran dehydrogenase subunit E
MDNITIEVTPEQRLILLHALANWAETRKDMYDYNEIEQLRTMVSNTKCGDRYCSYCGDLTYNNDMDVYSHDEHPHRKRR